GRSIGSGWFSVPYPEEGGGRPVQVFGGAPCCPVILAASRSDRMRRLVSAAPGTRQVVDRFIPGETVDEVLPIVQELTGNGLELTMDVVGEDITTPAQAGAARDAYL